MCGRFNATFDNGVKKLYTSLKINKIINNPIDSRFVKAADTVSVVRNIGAQRRVENATWWLLLDETIHGFKPSRYTSFNTRFDKLNVPRSAGYQAFRSSRCLLAVKGFGETEFVNKKPVHYYDMVAESGGLLLGGLCREWHHKTTGEIKLSCSVITLPPHEKLKHIHSKAMPLILPQEPSVIDRWLNPEVHEIDQFEPLLQPHIPQNIIAQCIDKPSSYNPKGNSQIITQD
ncbi:SOS response-associated peptidase family protein [Thalassotalea euphylliae]|uniref:SOS response-associated peptidase family protein n=1 Tax=Thalassotalea euphylliae TaxID=1655234 RepID=UPI00362EAD04